VSWRERDAEGFFGGWVENIIGGSFVLRVAVELLASRRV